MQWQNSTDSIAAVHPAKVGFDQNAGSVVKAALPLPVCLVGSSVALEAFLVFQFTHFQ